MKFILPEHSPMMGKNFVYGVATAAYQIEGAIEEGGRGESIWDRFSATPGKVLNGDTGANACDHYHRWQDDLDLIQSLNMDAYRFSIAWPRIEPEPGCWNEAGLAFYENLVEGLLARGIKPFVTLYHWDLPQYLQDKGGWVNRETAYRFARYAEKVAERLGDRVESYATFNEPWCSAFLGYRTGTHAPGLESDRLGFQAAHHLLLAHGLALPLMRAQAPKAEHGIVLNFTPNYAASHKPEDQAAAVFADEENSHWFLQPLLQGRYPELIAEKHPEWLPTQMPEDLEIIAQELDFLGVNFYTCQRVQADGDNEYRILPVEAEKTDIGWEICSQALTELLLEFKQRYTNLPPLFITENGAADNTEPNTEGHVNDQLRCDYYQAHLKALHHAVIQGVNLKGYFAWSLMDNFEWAEGYSQRFGLVYVNYSTQKRTKKASSLAWQAFLQGR